MFGHLFAELLLPTVSITSVDSGRAHLLKTDGAIAKCRAVLNIGDAPLQLEIMSEPVTGFSTIA
jgi:hypothetical protein